MMKSKIATLLATVFYIGRIPGAPGTYGSFFAVLAFYLVYRLGGRIVPELHLSVICLLSIAGVLASAEVSRLLQREDPSEVVIDEVAGQILSFYLIPISITNLAAGFFLFRFLDIWKPFPARQAERLGHGVGIMADDLIAGLYANLLLHLLGRFIPH